MTFPQFPRDFVYPTITAAQAQARGISPGSLLATAAWNERRGGKRRKRQASELRATAAALAANDNVARLEVAA